MPRDRRRSCVRDRTTGLWCALKGPADPDAWSYELLCGYFMVLVRGHIERRVPTCPDCLKALEYTWGEIGGEPIGAFNPEVSCD